MQFQDHMPHEHYVRLNKAAAWLLLFSCATLLSLALVRFFALAQWEALSLSEQRLERMSGALSGKNGAAALKSRLSDLQDSLTDACASLSQDFGDSKDLSGIVRLLIVKANAAGIQFVKMRPPTETAGAASATYPLVLELTTSYHSLGRFVSSMESLPHLVRVDRIALVAGRNNTVEVRILITCFLHLNG